MLGQKLSHVSKRGPRRQCRQLAATQDTCDVYIKSAAGISNCIVSLHFYALQPLIASFKAWDHLVIIWSWDVPQFTPWTIYFQHILWVLSTIFIKGIQWTSQYNEVVMWAISVTCFHVMKNKPVNCINDLFEITQQNLINIAFPRLKVTLRTPYSYSLVYDIKRSNFEQVVRLSSTRLKIYLFQLSTIARLAMLLVV